MKPCADAATRDSRDSSDEAETPAFRGCDCLLDGPHVVAHVLDCFQPFLNAGEAFANARGTAHQFVNVGDKPVRLATTLVVDKGQPRTMTQAELK